MGWWLTDTQIMRKQLFLKQKILHLRMKPLLHIRFAYETFTTPTPEEGEQVRILVSMLIFKGEVSSRT